MFPKDSALMILSKGKKKKKARNDEYEDEMEDEDYDEDYEDEMRTSSLLLRGEYKSDPKTIRLRWFAH